MNTERIHVGQIVGAFGIKGHVKVEATTSFESRFEKGNILFMDGKPIKIESFKMHKGRPLLKLEGIETMSQAEALQWKQLEAEGDPELDDDEYFVDDLIGLSVLTREGEMLGVIDAIEDYPTYQIISVGEILIPLIDEFVTEIDLEEKVVRVKLLYGMRPGED